MTVLTDSDRQRGVFPLPLPEFKESSSVCMSRSSQRKTLARRHVHSWVCDMVDTLNCMFSGSEFAAKDFCVKPNLSQKLCLDRLQSAVLHLGKPPENVSGQGALNELRANMGYSGEPASLAGYQKDLISLPGVGDVPSSLDVILGNQAESVLGTLRQKLLSQSEVGARKAESSLKAPYSDPIFRRQRQVYSDFVSQLHASNLVEFRTQARERVGVFFVWKKSGKQRMVVDSRLSNMWFGAPEKVHLATGSAFSRIEVDEGPAIEIGGVDIKDAFYRIELPHEFRDLFSLSPLPAKALDPVLVKSMNLEGDQLVYPCFRVVPMGWAHALWICQTCHEKVTNDLVSIPASLRLSDMRPAPDLQPFIHAEYVDNFIALTQEKGLAHELACKVEQELNIRGLPTHPVESTVGGETLGWQFDSEKPHVTMTPRRLWKLKLAINELLRQGWGSGQLVERIVGHCTFAALLRRELLSCFQAVYVFIRKRYHVHGRLWPEVARELRWVSSLLPLVHRDLSAQWSPHVFAVDASTWGRGVVKAEASVDLVREQAKYLDRWRFKIDDERQVQRSEVVGAGCCADILEFEIANQHTDTVGIPEVDPSILNLSWKKVNSSPWKRPEAIPVLEGRALVWTVQHLARSQVNHGKRHLILSDSMTAILALTKGRGNSRSMNRIARQIAALSLACDFQLNYRWIASELNAADSPSRCRNVDFDFSVGLSSFLSSHVREKAQSWRRQAAEFYENFNGSARAELTFSRLCRTREGKDSQRKTSPEGSEPSAETRSPVSCQSVQRSQDDFAGVNECVEHPEGVLCPSMESLQRICQDSPLADSKPGATGRSGGLVDRPFVFPRGEHSLRHDFHGGCQTLSERPVKNVQFVQSNAGPQRVQEDGAWSDSCATTLPNACLDRSAHSAHKAKNGRLPLAAPDLALVCQARRGIQAPVETYGCPKPHQSVLVSGDVPVSRRGGRCHAVQSWGDGRECDIECQFPSVDESFVAAPEEIGQRQRLCVPFPTRSGKQDFRGCSSRTWVSKPWRSVHLPDPPRSCLDRSVVPRQIAGRCDEKRPMENSGVRETLRTRRQTRSGIRVVAQKGSTTVPRRRGRVSSANVCLRWLQQAAESSLFLEIFSGSGNLSRAVAACFHGNLTVVPIDLCHGNEHDLEKRSIQHFVLAAIRTGKVAGVWLGTPCTSWSRARQLDGRGPGPLRSDNQLRGLANLSVADQARVRTGNVLADFSALIFETCEKMGIPVCLENPATSRMWLLPRFKRLRSKSSVQVHLTDYCQDGKPWRKRTRLMSSGVDLGPCVRQCNSHRGICSRTGKAHVQLCGHKPGTFMTSHAQPYPVTLCKRVAKAFENAMFEYRARPYMQLVFHSMPDS